VARRVRVPWAASLACAATLALLLAGFWLARGTGLGGGGSPYGFRAMAFALVAAAFAMTHGWAWRGPRFALRFMAVATATSLVTETAGVLTGLIFGPYAYSPQFGAKIFGLVPAVIPLIWFSMSYLAFVTAETIVGRGMVGRAAMRPAIALSAGLLLGYDVVADPNHVFRGGWAYTGGGLFYGVPLQNFVAWYAIGLVMFWAVRRLDFRPPAEPVGSPSLLALGGLAYIGILLHESAFALLIARRPGTGLAGVGLVVLTAALLGRALGRIRRIVLPNRALASSASPERR
jgi:uncharacterized membrane protein